MLENLIHIVYMQCVLYIYWWEMVHTEKNDLDNNIMSNTWTACQNIQHRIV